MKKGLEVKNIVFGKLRQISSTEFSGNIPWDESADGADVKLLLTNSSKEKKSAYIYIISKPDMLTTELDSTTFSTTFSNSVEVKPGEEKEVSYPAFMFSLSSSDYKDYTGPWRCAVTVTVSDWPQNEVLLKKVKYYDIPAKVEANELEESPFDIQEALKDLEKTTVLHDFHIEGSPKESVKSIAAKLFNFGEKTQYVGIDMRAERKREEGHSWSYGTSLFHQLGPKEEIPVDIDPKSALPPEVTPESLTGMDYLKIRAVSIPEHIFKSQKARAWFVWRSYEEEGNYNSLIAKFDFYFRERE